MFDSRPFILSLSLRGQRKFKQSIDQLSQFYLRLNECRIPQVYDRRRYFQISEPLSKGYSFLDSFPPVSQRSDRRIEVILSVRGDTQLLLRLLQNDGTINLVWFRFRYNALRHKVSVLLARTTRPESALELLFRPRLTNNINFYQLKHMFLWFESPAALSSSSSRTIELTTASFAGVVVTTPELLSEKKSRSLWPLNKIGHRLESSRRYGVSGFPEDMARQTEAMRAALKGFMTGCAARYQAEHY